MTETEIIIAGLDRVDAIRATDGTPRAVAEAMRGCHPDVFDMLDTRDNYPDVPDWHPLLRRARNNCSDFFAILNDRKD
jgi:hypothetical protein